MATSNGTSTVSRLNLREKSSLVLVLVACHTPSSPRNCSTSYSHIFNAWFRTLEDACCALTSRYIFKATSEVILTARTWYSRGSAEPTIPRVTLLCRSDDPGYHKRAGFVQEFSSLRIISIALRMLFTPRLYLHLRKTLTMRPSTTALVLITTFASSAVALLVTPDSPCEKNCGNVLSSTTGADIVCDESQYSLAPAGIVYQNCVGCEARSNFSENGQSDLQWLLCKDSVIHALWISS